MKYTKPTAEIFVVEAKDIITTSGEQGSITVDNVTITGPKEEFYANFIELLVK